METMGVPKILERKITLQEVAELEKPTQNIIGKIKEKIERGEYGIIIGDDASGRIPTLILGGFIKKISKLKNLPEPNIIFIPGKLNETEDFLVAKEKKLKLQKHLFEYGVKRDDRILIVTEAIASGRSLGVLSHLLKAVGFEVDIATMGIESPENSFYQQAREKNLGNSNIILGNYSRKEPVGQSHTPLVYSQGKIINGIYKISGDLKSITKKSQFRNYFSEKASTKEKEIQEKINQSRAEINILVDKLVDWYLAEEGRK